MAFRAWKSLRGKSLAMDIIIVSNVLLTWYSLPSQLRRQARSRGLGHPFFGGKCPGAELGVCYGGRIRGKHSSSIAATNRENGKFV